jgi:hypothetical protein
LVDSSGGSIGKIFAGVYTDVVFVCACASSADPRRTSASTSAMAISRRGEGPSIQTSS